MVSRLSIGDRSRFIHDTARTVRGKAIRQARRLRCANAARVECDFIEMNGIDQWLGGVHLRDGNLWRWDEVAQELAAG